MTQVLHLSMKPEWQRVETVGDDAGAFLRASHLDEGAAAAMAMAAEELAENAVKYGASLAEEDIEISVSVNDALVAVEVRNRVSEAEAANLARLNDTIQWIRRFEDPLEAYRERLRTVSAQALDTPESGLGLTRIAYEGRAFIDYFINDRNILAVSAIHHR